MKSFDYLILFFGACIVALVVNSVITGQKVAEGQEELESIIQMQQYDEPAPKTSSQLPQE